MHEWIKPGAEVVTVDYNRFTRRMVYGSTKKIDKVHKTGRFTLEGSNQQYARSTAGEYAFATGHAGWSGRTRIEPVTPQLLANIEREKKIVAALKIVADESTRLARLARLTSGDDDTILIEAERIINHRVD